MPEEYKVFGLTENLRSVAWTAIDDPHGTMIVFQARYTEEEIAFRITTTSPIRKAKWFWDEFKGTQFLFIHEEQDDFSYSIFIGKRFMKNQFKVGLLFDPCQDPKELIESISILNTDLLKPELASLDFGP